MDLTTKVVRRWLSANVVPFRPNSKSSLPKIEIGGKKYVLSDDAGPIASETFGAEEEGSSGHARLIRGPAHGSKFKYLWVYDTDHKYVVMWRTTDGNEKLAGPANSVMHYVLRLDQKGHLNRVPNEEYRKIESAMRKLEDETYEALKKTNKENETDFQKEVNARTQEFFDHHVRPKIERAIHDVQQGAVPLGFKPFGPKGEPSLRQMTVHVISKIVASDFTFDKVEAYLTAHGLDPQEHGRDNQAAQWATQEIYEAVLEELVPPR